MPSYTSNRWLVRLCCDKYPNWGLKVVAGEGLEYGVSRVVTSVEPWSPAWHAGISVGDTITRTHDPLHQRPKHWASAMRLNDKHVTALMVTVRSAQRPPDAVTDHLVRRYKAYRNLYVHIMFMGLEEIVFLNAYA